jgi:carbon monoxide dehydrogenase subunit G
MIEAEHALVVDADIDDVWTYVRDIQNWAMLFPGCRECEVIDDNDSRWTLKVGAGGMIKTVIVLVHVDVWDAPGGVAFSYQLEKEPVVGKGTYTATRKSDTETDVCLGLEVAGSGQMAGMWEALCKPLLPEMARVFGAQLKREIELSLGVVPPAAVPAGGARPSLLRRLWRWFRSLW